MSRSIRNETSSLAFGVIGRFGGSSAGFVVTALNAASAVSREGVGLRVLSADILLPSLAIYSDSFSCDFDLVEDRRMVIFRLVDRLLRRAASGPCRRAKRSNE